MTHTPGGALPRLAQPGGRAPGERGFVYELIADDLRERIRSGQFKPGGRIPLVRCQVGPWAPLAHPDLCCAHLPRESSGIRRRWAVLV
ncbi:hypothetical protein [Streptomyces sp. NBC_00467]|uniref:hypothetical protein n=1 Tax=Streptomyces sp. NBC_00467 TaxID=2975752 RepID=UPI002E18A968